MMPALFMALLLSAASLEAQGLVLGFGGQAVPGRWNPLSIDSSVLSRADRVRLEFRGAEGRDLGSETFLLGASRREALPVMLGLDLKSIRAVFLRGGGRIGEYEVDATARSFNGHIVLCVGQDRAAIRAIGSVLSPKEMVQAVETTASDLPAHPLAWDCVSALVLNEGSSVLSPAQEEALGSWLACGGKLILTNARSGADILLPGAAGIARLRAGDIPRSEAEAQGFWNSALGLRPYAESTRLSVTTSFSSAAIPRGRGIGFLPLLSILVLAALVGALAFLLRTPALARFRPALLAAWAAAASLVAWILGGSFVAQDGRGASAILRAVVLPGEAGILADLRVSLKTSEERGPSIMDISPLRLGLDFDRSEEGTFGNQEGAEWKHRSRRPWFSLARGDASCSILQGLLPAVAASGSDAQRIPSPLILRKGRPENPPVPPRGNLALRQENGVWWTWIAESGVWGRSSGAPAFLGPDMAWIAGVRALMAGPALLVGDSPMPAMSFRAEGRSLERMRAFRVLWATSIDTREAGE